MRVIFFRVVLNKVNIPLFTRNLLTGAGFPENVSYVFPAFPTTPLNKSSVFIWIFRSELDRGVVIFRKEILHAINVIGVL